MSTGESDLSEQVQRLQMGAESLVEQVRVLREALTGVLQETEELRHRATATQRRLMALNTHTPEGIPGTDELGRTLRRFQEIGRQLETVAEPLRLNMESLHVMVGSAESALRRFIAAQG